MSTSGPRQKKKALPHSLDSVVPTLQPVPRRGRVQSPDEDLRHQAARLYSDGMSLAEVGEAIGCSLPKARRLVVEAGVEIRPPGRGKKPAAKRTQGVERLPGVTWLPSEDSFMAQERRRMLRYMVEEKGMGWSECQKGLGVPPHVLQQDLQALGLKLEPDEPEPAGERPQRRQGRRLKDAEHLMEDVASMRSMRGQGFGLSDIANIFGISVVTLKKRLTMTDADIRAEVEAATRA